MSPVKSDPLKLAREKLARLKGKGIGKPPGPPRKKTAAAGDDDDDRAKTERNRSARRARAASEHVKEIGPLPAVVDPDRRERCRFNLRLACLTYFAPRFPLPFSPDHDRVIAQLQRCILEGGLFALAMPRGSGKTTLVECAILWAVLNGHRIFPVVVGATTSHAENIIAAIKAEIECNPLLLEDYPEACYPVRCLDGIAQRAKGQTLNGRRTRLEWGGAAFRLADIAGAPCAAVNVEGRGLDGAIRGMKQPGPNGRQVRPDLAVLDDPQTDESARMPGQCSTRERTINGAVLGLAGPGKTIAAVMPCTVVAPGDVSDRFLDHERNPQWNGERTRTLNRLPTDLDWWDRYAEVRRESFRRHKDAREANDLYARERDQADAGAEVAWPERFDPKKCLSAIQEAMNTRIDRPAAFAAECQNDPLSLTPEADALALDPVAVARRLNGVPRGIVPGECSRLTSFIDVSETVLWWLVAGWDDRFGGAVVDYGTFPPQPVTYFRQADARRTLRDRYPGQPIEAAVYSGLKELTAQLFGREWQTEAGQAVEIERGLIDAGDLSAVIYQLCRAVPYPVTPSKGFGIGASGRPLREWPRKPGERFGQDWILGYPESGQGKLLKFDTNEWKTFTAERLRTPEQAAGCLRLFGKPPADSYAHELIADHFGAEYPVETMGRGRRLKEWKVRPGQDNHLFDCMVGAALAASFAGVKWDAPAAAGDPSAPPPAPKEIDLADLYRDAGND